MIVLFVVHFLLGSALADEAKIRLYPGYLTKIRCEGRLLVSAVGNDSLVRLEPLPKDLGCAVVVKPLSIKGQTNLLIETSTGTIERIIEISPASILPTPNQLEYRLKGDSK